MLALSKKNVKSDFLRHNLPEKNARTISRPRVMM
jgi:hypothetical protein